MASSSPMAAQRRKRLNVRPFLRVFDRFLKILLVALVFGLAIVGAFALYDRTLRPYTLTIAAGGKSGESFLISRALETVIERRLGNVNIEVVATDGTEANLNQLENGQAQFAAAQADIINTFSDRIQTSQARSVAVLYEDTLQLLVCDPAIKDFSGFLERLRDTAALEAVYVPLLGGQRLSFLHIAEHFGLREDEHFFFSGEGAVPGACDAGSHDKMIFRVRIAGNEEVGSYLNEGWRLLSIDQVAAMRLKNAALRPALIPTGTYAGSVAGPFIVPVPAEDVSTIGVDRLLLARADVPDWIVYEVADVLNNAGQELADALLSYGYEITSDQPGGSYRAYIEEFVIPLVPNIASLNAGSSGAIGAPLHSGAYSFYRPNESWFTWLNSNADGLGLGVTAATIGGSLALALNRAMQRARKDTVDGYLKELTFLKRLGPEAQAPTGDEEIARMRHRLGKRVQAYTARRTALSFEELPPDNEILDASMITELIDEACRIDRLHEVFDAASRALEQERISEESFRTFTEAYKSVRETIEQRGEEVRRAIALFYVNQTMRVIDSTRQRVATQESLDFIRAEASRVLTDQLVFSRESFRTYIDAYTLAKETLASRGVAQGAAR